MLTTVNQRWTEKKDSYRPAGEVIRTAEYEVAPILETNVAKAFVERHHYARRSPAVRRAFGLYRHGAMVGTALFSHPGNNAVLNIFPGDMRESMELGRFVLVDEVPGNGETWFLARCFELLREEGFVGIVSYSDPIPRQNETGSTIFAGHIGTIYQAHNAVYMGRGKPRTLRVLPDGTVFSEICISKIKTRKKGWVYSSELLVEAGASPLSETADPVAWLDEWLPRLTRPLKHPGNHKYAWMLDRKQRKHLPASLQYPKMNVAMAA